MTNAINVSILNRAATIFGLVVSIVLIAMLFVYGRSEQLFQAKFDVVEDSLKLNVEPGPALVERGRRIASVVAQCHFCHGPDLSGRELADDRWIGRLHAPNLTTGRGGIGGNYTNADWVRSIRFGVRRNGRSLLLMPSAHLAQISDGDLAAVIAYMRQLPPVIAERPEIRVGWLTRLALSVGAAPDLLSAPMVNRTQTVSREIPVGPSREYGSYLVALGSCRVCHRLDLKGGLHPLALPGEPSPPDLTLGGSMSNWSREDFARAMREGRTPDGRQLDREFMPWPAFSGLSDLEIDALWLYFSGGTQSI